MITRSLKLSFKELDRIQAAADMSGETFNAFVRRVAHKEAVMEFIKRSPDIWEALVGNAFDNYLLRRAQRSQKKPARDG